MSSQLFFTQNSQNMYISLYTQTADPPDPFSLIPLQLQLELLLCILVQYFYTNLQSYFGIICYRYFVFCYPFPPPRFFLKNQLYLFFNDYNLLEQDGVGSSDRLPTRSPPVIGPKRRSADLNLLRPTDGDVNVSVRSL